MRSQYNGELEHRDTVRKGSKLLYEYIDAGWVNAPQKNSCDFNNPSEKVALHKERIKLQTERLELNRWLRENARDEILIEQIHDAITSLPQLEIPEQNGVDISETGYALVYGDSHLGDEFTIKGLFGEVINAYSPEIFENRMWSLYNRTLNIIAKENIRTLHVYDLGDDISGLLRVSQLMKIRYGVVDQTIKYASFISNWLNELSKHVNIVFEMIIDANHSQLRLLDGKKNTFKNENMSKVIFAFIKERLSNNKNIVIKENPTGLIFDNICGYNILGIHGETKNMDATLKDMSRTYKVDISYLLGAHLHHGKQEDVGMDIETINVPSIIGVDDYSMSLNKTSNAGAKLLCFEEGMGKTIEYNIKLQ